MINNLVVGLLLLYSTLAFTRDVFHERVLWYDNPSHEALIAWTSENETARNHVLVSLNSDMSDARIYTNCMSGRIKTYVIATTCYRFMCILCGRCLVLIVFYIVGITPKTLQGQPGAQPTHCQPPIFPIL